MKYIISTLLLSAAMLWSCQKKDNTTPDAAKVTINITSPTAAQLFRAGDTVHIAATVSYPSELHGYEVKITDTTTGFVLYDDAQHVHNDHFEINDTWVNTATQSMTLKLELTTEVDHNGTEANKVVYFQYQP